MDIVLGELVRDKVTGFRGTLTGKAEYLNNNPQAAGRVEFCDPNGCLNEMWFPLERLEVVG